MTRLKRGIDWLTRGKDGRVYVFQFPNFPLAGWLVCAVASHVATDSAGAGFSSLSTAFLAIWCYLEVTQGSSRLRRILGAMVAVAIVRSFFS